MAISDRIAVMSDGVVVQEGTAEDLYHRPASAFVAQFIGRVNLLAGRVVDCQDGVITVDAAGGRLRVPMLTPLAAGAAVRLVVRPEGVELVADTAGTAGDISGTIVARTFLGEKVDYHVRAGVELFLVTRYNPGPGAVFDEGERVRLRLTPGSIHLLPEGT